MVENCQTRQKCLDRACHHNFVFCWKEGRMKKWPSQSKIYFQLPELWNILRKWELSFDCILLRGNCYTLLGDWRIKLWAHQQFVQIGTYFSITGELLKPQLPSFFALKMKRKCFHKHLFERPTIRSMKTKGKPFLCSTLCYMMFYCTSSKKSNNPSLIEVLQTISKPPVQPEQLFYHHQDGKLELWGVPKIGYNFKGILIKI